MSDNLLKSNQLYVREIDKLYNRLTNSVYDREGPEDVLKIVGCAVGKLTRVREHDIHYVSATSRAIKELFTKAQKQWESECVSFAKYGKQIKKIEKKLSEFGGTPLVNTWTTPSYRM